MCTLAYKQLITFGANFFQIEPFRIKLAAEEPLFAVRFSPEINIMYVLELQLRVR